MAAAGAFYPRSRGFVDGPAGDRLCPSQAECESFHDELWEPERGDVAGAEGGGRGGTGRSVGRKQPVYGNYFIGARLEHYLAAISLKVVYDTMIQSHTQNCSGSSKLILRQDLNALRPHETRKHFFMEAFCFWEDLSSKYHAGTNIQFKAPQQKPLDMPQLAFLTLEGEFPTLLLAQRWRDFLFPSEFQPRFLSSVLFLCVLAVHQLSNTLLRSIFHLMT